jgi:hypothetical protein
MIVHEAVGMAEPVISFRDVLKGIKEGLAVMVVSVNGLFFVPSAGDMIDSSRVFYAQRTSHRGIIS